MEKIDLTLVPLCAHADEEKRRFKRAKEIINNSEAKVLKEISDNGILDGKVLNIVLNAYESLNLAYEMDLEDK